MEGKKFFGGEPTVDVVVAACQQGCVVGVEKHGGGGHRGGGEQQSCQEHFEGAKWSLFAAF